MAAIRRLELLNWGILTVDRFKRVNVRHLPNFMAIGQTVTEISRFFNFQNGSRLPSFMLKSSEF